MKVSILYFAQLRQQCGLGEEQVETGAHTIEDLYGEVCRRHAITLPKSGVRAARNEEFCTMETQLQDHDTVAFMPPLSGG